MTNKKLLMFALAGAVAPAVSVEVASAESTGSAISVMVPAPVKDLAPVNTAGRLRRTDQEQPGNEMPAFAFFIDPATGKSTTNGLYFSMTTELNGTVAQNRMQLSSTPIKLTQDASTGSVYVEANTAAAKFITANNGNERRNANAPTAMALANGTIVVKYNYQQNGSGDTKTYFQVYNSAGQQILAQTEAIAHNNDDCSMHQDAEPGVAVQVSKTVTKLVDWAGCNGNGRDDGWAEVTTLTFDSATAPTKATFAKVYSLSLAAQEERSRGACTVAAADPSYAVCTWTEGNSQPQRQGVWAAAIDLTATNANNALLWKTQVAGRIDNNPLAATPNNPTGRRTYAQRIIQERVSTTDTATGALVPSDKMLITYGDAVGNNNNKGTYVSRMVGVAQVSKTALTWLSKPTDLATTSLGRIGGTHLGATAMITGTGAPGLLFMSGSLNGGGGNAVTQGVAVDPSTMALTVLGSTATSPQDMHLYPNYLGNNPGNQGRNHSQLTTIANPFVGQGGSTSKYLLLTASTAKTLATTANAGALKTADTMINPAIKLTALMTVTPMGGMAKAAAAAGPTADTDVANNEKTDSSDPGTTLGGCQASGGSSGFAVALLVGLAAFARRRRS
jgi:uncharacterized protein (TIGR03382 family)